MKNKSTFLLFLLIIISLNGNAETIDTPKEEIVETQSHSNSCGAMSLSHLLSNVSDKKITELDVMNAIRLLTGNEKDDYSIGELEKAAQKFGFSVQTGKLAPTILPNLKQPVILLMGLTNQDFRHFVVLKGIVNGIAYLYDPARKNMRLPYNTLIEQSINKEHPSFYILAVKGNADKIKKSSLYLSEIQSERDKTHYTEEQANALTLATLSKENQFIVDYDFTAALGNRKKDGLATDSQNFSHAVNIRYGITDELQIGATFQHTDSYAQFSFEDTKLKQNSDDRAYGLNISNRFKLDAAGEYNLIAGLNGSYSEQNSIYSGGFNATAYTNTSFAQFFVGGSINKQFARNSIKNLLPQFNYSVFVSANKPFADRYLGFVNLSLSDAQAKNNDSEFNRSYSVSTGVSYVLSKHFQISPSFGYSFGQMDTFSFGMNIAYVGGW